jgi:hypothetical protein
MRGPRQGWLVGVLGWCAAAFLPMNFPLSPGDAAAATAPLVASPGALILTAPQGKTAAGTLLLKKSSTDRHTYSLSTNQSWIWMNPPYGSTHTIATETDQVVITAQTTGLSPGTYSAVVYVTDSGPAGHSQMLRIPVSFTVTAAPGSVTPPTPPPATPPSATPPPTPPAIPVPRPRRRWSPGPASPPPRPFSP